MLFITILTILIYCILLSIVIDYKKDILFNFLWIILFILTAIRYGIGPDYFSYMNYYKNATPSNIYDALTSDVYFEKGYMIMSSIFKNLHLDFTHLIFFITMLIFILYWLVINKYSKNKILSLFIFYTLYYQVYVLNLLRQGIAMSIFFIAYFKFLKNRKYMKYIIYIFISSLFHKATLITLILVIVRMKDNYFLKNKLLNYLLIVISVCLCFFKGDILLRNIGIYLGINQLINYETSGINVFAITLRIIFFVGIIILYKCSYKNKLDDFDDFQVYTYFIGTITYIALSNNKLYSRFTDIFMMVDIILVPNLLSKTKIIKSRLYIFPVILILYSTLFVKDMITESVNGKYFYKDITKYPYVTIFNKEEIYKYRID